MINVITRLLNILRSCNLEIMQIAKTYLHFPVLQRTGFCLLLTANLLGCWQGEASDQIPKRPNILVILTDDQGYPTLGTFGGRMVQTPHLDQLASEGIYFTDAYATSQCTPTRASLLTGQYTARNKMWHVIGWYGYPWARMIEPSFRENLSRDSFTIAKGLKDAGYRTGIVGKWHLTTNEDGNYMQLNAGTAHHYGFDFAPPPLEKAVFDEGGDRGIQALTEQALTFIAEQPDEPWFCLVSHHMIHGKVVAPDSLVTKYRNLGYGEEGPNRALYLSGLELIDWSVGALIKGLEELGEADETMIAFVSDNGGINERLDFKTAIYDSTGTTGFIPDIREYDNAPLRAGKGSVYEGGIRVPMIIKWPRNIVSGRKISVPVHVIDLGPTFFEVAGAVPKHTFDGLSLIDLLQNKDNEELANRALFQYYPFYDLRWGLTPSASIRQGNYKLIEFFGDRVDSLNRYQIGHQLELYNLEEDIGETNNLIEKEPQVAAELKEWLDAWLAEMEVEIPAKNPRFDPSRAFLETRDKIQ